MQMEIAVRSYRLSSAHYLFQFDCQFRAMMLDLLAVNLLNVKGRLIQHYEQNNSDGQIRFLI